MAPKNGESSSDDISDLGKGSSSKKPTKEPTVPCPLAQQYSCQKLFTTVGNANIHAKIHTGANKIKCPDCDHIASNKSNLKQHREYAHRAADHRRYPCPDATKYNCSKTFQTQFDANKHAKLHTRAHEKSCPVCHKTISNAGNLKIHMKNAHPAKDAPKVLFPCPYASKYNCQKQFVSKPNAELHGKIHTGELKVNCPHCDLVISSASNLRKHIATHHPDAGTDKDGNTHKCPLAVKYNCNRKFATKALADKHAKSHKDTTTFKCSACVKEFKTQDDLNEHATEHLEKAHKDKLTSADPNQPLGMNPGKMYPCPVAAEYNCSDLFFTRQGAEKHVRTHDLKRKVPCPRCDKQIADWYLPEHLKTVHGEGGKAAADKSQHAVKSVPCPFAQTMNCNDMFATRVTAHAHAKKQHTGTKPFCHYCLKIVLSTKALLAHQRLVHPNATVYGPRTKSSAKSDSKDDDGATNDQSDEEQEMEEDVDDSEVEEGEIVERDSSRHPSSSREIRIPRVGTARKSAGPLRDVVMTGTNDLDDKNASHMVHRGKETMQPSDEEDEPPRRPQRRTGNIVTRPPIPTNTGDDVEMTIDHAAHANAPSFRVSTGRARLSYDSLDNIPQDPPRGLQGPSLQGSGRLQCEHCHAFFGSYEELRRHRHEQHAHLLGGVMVGTGDSSILSLIGPSSSLQTRRPLSSFAPHTTEHNTPVATMTSTAPQDTANSATGAATRPSTIPEGSVLQRPPATTSLSSQFAPRVTGHATEGTSSTGLLLPPQIPAGRVTQAVARTRSPAPSNPEDDAITSLMANLNFTNPIAPGYTDRPIPLPPPPPPRSPLPSQTQVSGNKRRFGSIVEPNIPQNLPDWYRGAPRPDDPEFPLNRPYACAQGYNEQATYPETIILQPGAKGRIVARRDDWLAVSNTRQDGGEEHGWVAAQYMEIGPAIFGRLSVCLDRPDISGMDPDPFNDDETDDRLSRMLKTLCAALAEYSEKYGIAWLKARLSLETGARMEFIKRMLDGFEATGARRILSRPDFSLASLLSSLKPLSSYDTDGSGAYIQANEFDDDGSFGLRTGMTDSFRRRNTEHDRCINSEDNEEEIYRDAREDRTKYTYVPICSGLASETDRVLVEQIIVLALGTYTGAVLRPILPSDLPRNHQNTSSVTQVPRPVGRALSTSTREGRYYHKIGAQEMTALAETAFTICGWEVASSRSNFGVRKGYNTSSPIFESSHGAAGIWLRTVVKGRMSVFRRTPLRVYRQKDSILLQIKDGWTITLGAKRVVGPGPEVGDEVFVVVEIMTDESAHEFGYMLGWRNELAPWDDWPQARGVAIRLEWVDSNNQWRQLYATRAQPLHTVNPNVEASLSGYECVMSLRKSLLRQVPLEIEAWHRPFALARIKYLELEHFFQVIYLHEDLSVVQIPGATRISSEEIIYNLDSLDAKNINVQGPPQDKCDVCWQMNDACNPQAPVFRTRFAFQCFNCFRMGRPCSFTPRKDATTGPDYLSTAVPPEAPLMIVEAVEARVLANLPDR